MAAISNLIRMNNPSDDEIRRIIKTTSYYRSELDSRHGICQFWQYEMLLRAVRRDETRLRERKLASPAVPVVADLKEQKDFTASATKFYFEIADTDQQYVVVPWEYHGPLLTYVLLLEDDLSDRYRRRFKRKCTTEAEEQEDDPDLTEEEEEEEKNSTAVAEKNADADEKVVTEENNKKKARAETEASAPCI